MRVELTFPTSDPRADSKCEILVDGRPPLSTVWAYDEANQLMTAVFATASTDKLPAPDAPIERPKHHRGKRPTRRTEVAAALIAAPKAGTQRSRVLHFFVEDHRHGGDGMTDLELSQRSGMLHYSAAPRRTELVEGGWLRESGRYRAGPSGADSIVWCLTERACRELDLPIVGQLSNHDAAGTPGSAGSETKEDR